MKTKSFLKGALIASALAAGAAFFVNKKLSSGTKAEAKKTVVDLTKKIVSRLQSLKQMSKGNFDMVVDAVIDEYQKGKKMSTDTAKEVKGELKSQWKMIERELRSESKIKKAKKKKSAARKK